MTAIKGLEVFEWEAESYAPLVFSQGWQVAILNWEPGAHPDAIYRVEQHNRTDEVFVLMRGAGALLIASPEGLEVVDCVPGRIYNVTQGTWHMVIGDRESSWLIVENRDTHRGDTTYRDMTAEELAKFHQDLPAWAAALTTDSGDGSAQEGA